MNFYQQLTNKYQRIRKDLRIYPIVKLNFQLARMGYKLIQFCRLLALLLKKHRLFCFRIS